jgi:hypothetical protein
MQPSIVTTAQDTSAGMPSLAAEEFLRFLQGELQREPLSSAA